MDDVVLSVSIYGSLRQPKKYTVKPSDKLIDLKKIFLKGIGKNEDEHVVFKTKGNDKALNDNQPISEIIKDSLPQVIMILDQKKGPPPPSSYIFRPNKLIDELPVDERYLRSLIDLGYPPELCKEALAASFNNIAKAAEYLINGYIPQRCKKSRMSRQSDQSKSCTSEEEVSNSKNDLNYSPNFSNNDIAIINKLKNEGFDEILIPQVYLACNKDEQNTRELLATFTNEKK